MGNLSFILDIGILVIAGMTVFFAIKKGFVGTIIESLSFILAAVLSLFLSPLFKDIFGSLGSDSEIATYFIVFVISWIIIKLICKLLNKVLSSIPFINSINKVGGAILGILLGLFRISIFCISVGSILSIFEKFDIDLLSSITIENTILFNFFYEYNPLYLMINLILK